MTMNKFLTAFQLLLAASASASASATTTTTATATALMANPDFFSIITNSTSGQGAFRCGGTLIHPDIILTASSCSIPGDVVRVGYQNDTHSIAIRTTADVRNHPMEGDEAKNEIFRNDLSLIKLDQPVWDIVPLAVNSDRSLPTTSRDPVYFAHAGQLQDEQSVFNLGTIPLPPKPIFASTVQVGATTTTLMKGRTIGCPALHQAWSAANGQGYKPTLVPRVQFCVNRPAAVETSDGGDSNMSAPCDTFAWGSPLWFMKDDGVPLLAGSASQGSCQADSPPFIYTKIANYHQWIQETICSMSEIKPEYCDALCKAAPTVCA